MLSVKFLGTSAARPTVERSVSSIVVARKGETLMFDCGEGTQRQMMRYGVSFSLSQIFFTHFHADHYLGIIGLVRTLALQGRTDPVHLYGPKGANRVLGACMQLGFERAGFPVEIHELEAGDRLGREDYDLEVLAVEHGRDAVGYAIREHERLGRFDPEKARELRVVEGPLWGRLHRGESVTLDDGRVIDPAELVGPKRPGRLVVLTGDTAPCGAVVAAATGADLLVHDATFGEEEKDRARETSHSTAVQAAQVALAARVKRLILTHLSARYSTSAKLLADEARAVFEDVEVARDGMEVEVPYVGEG
ncbi:MAG: ribonuclease Z [Gemmatimonadales bacterium]